MAGAEVVSGAGRAAGGPSALLAILDRHRGAENRARPPVTRGMLPGWRRVAALPTALPDRAGLKLMERLFLMGDRPDLRPGVRERIEQTRATYASSEILRDPELFFRPVQNPAELRLRELGRLPGGSRLRLTFESTYRTLDRSYEAQYRSFKRNEIARVHFWRHDERGRPTVVCVHSWCSGVLRFDEHVFAARSLYRDGFDVALFTMPFHGGRTPKQARFAGQLFPSRNLQRTNEAFAQAVADLRVLTRWLREEQACGPLGMMGLSLGGYTTALMAALEDDLAFAIPIAAPCSFADILWYHGEGLSSRAEAEEAGITLQDLRAIFAAHCPLSHAPKIPRERFLMVWGEGDRVVPSVHQLALWEWANRPEIYSYPGGHLVHLGRLGYLREIRRWLRRQILS